MFWFFLLGFRVWRNSGFFGEKFGMDNFSNIRSTYLSYELIDVQNTIQDIYHLKRNNYISDLHEGEIEELQYYKNYLKIFIKIFKS